MREIDLKKVHDELENIQRELTDERFDYTEDEIEFNGDLIWIVEELKTLRKAYELMAVKYCKHTVCYFCEVTDKCELYLGTKKGSENLMEYFLKEAQKNNNET